MMLNAGVAMIKNKIACIIVNYNQDDTNDLYNDLSAMIIPEEYSAEFIEVESQCTNIEAYREITEITQAKYKIYINSKMRINNSNFIVELLDLFTNNDDIAVVGCIGSPVITTDAKYRNYIKRVGKLYYLDNTFDNWEDDSSIVDAKFIENFVYATQYEIPWQYDDFEKDEYLITSKCIDYRKKGYRTVICHELSDGLIYNGYYINEYNERDRQVFLEKYSKDIFPLVSILLPTYNRPEYMQIALNSALNQDYKNIEILISDASEDNKTKKIMKRYLKKYPNILYNHVPGGNNWVWLWEHMNSKAEYFNWLMDDDMYYPNKISTMINYFMLDPKVTLVTSVRDLIDYKGDKMPDSFNKPICPETSTFDGRTIGKHILQHTTNFIGEPTTALIKKTCIDSISGWGDIAVTPGMLSLGDIGMWLELMSKGNLVYITDRLSAFRLHGNNDSCNEDTSIRCTLNWMMYINYAWNNKIFIDNMDEFVHLVNRWIAIVIQNIYSYNKEGYASATFDKLKKMYLEVAKSVVNDYHMEIEM